MDLIKLITIYETPNRNTNPENPLDSVLPKMCFIDYESNNNTTTLNEMYVIGPAISILMEGYIVKNKLTSLRGTLVPATTINKTISKIPLLGNILVGKKVGEGVFGVSFKIKGPPKNLKTTVNPVKTLAPRFITRTVEQLKKKTSSQF